MVLDPFVESAQRRRELYRESVRWFAREHGLTMDVEQFPAFFSVTQGPPQTEAKNPLESNRLCDLEEHEATVDELPQLQAARPRTPARPNTAPGLTHWPSRELEDSGLAVDPDVTELVQTMAALTAPRHEANNSPVRQKAKRCLRGGGRRWHSWKPSQRGSGSKRIPSQKPCFSPSVPKRQEQVEHEESGQAPDQDPDPVLVCDRAEGFESHQPPDLLLLDVPPTTMQRSKSTPTFLKASAHTTKLAKSAREKVAEDTAEGPACSWLVVLKLRGRLEKRNVSRYWQSRGAFGVSGVCPRTLSRVCMASHFCPLLWHPHLPA